MAFSAMRTPKLSELNAPEVLDAVTAIILLLAFTFVCWRLQQGYRRRRSKRFLEKGVQAEAVIIERPINIPAVNSAIIFEFSDHRGNKFTGKLFCHSLFYPSQSIASLKAGETFTLIYDPENPRRNYPEVFLQQWMKQ